MDTAQRYIALNATRTKVDYAKFIAKVIETHYAQVPHIHLVQDNLNTHTKGSFYKAFPPEIAKDLAQKI